MADMYMVRLGEKVFTGESQDGPNLENLRSLRDALDEEIAQRAAKRSLREIVAAELFEGRRKIPARPGGRLRYPDGTKWGDIETVDKEIYRNYADSAFRAFFRHEPDSEMNGWQKFDDAISPLSLHHSDARVVDAIKSWAIHKTGSDLLPRDMVDRIAKEMWADMFPTAPPQQEGSDGEMKYRRLAKIAAQHIYREAVKS